VRAVRQPRFAAKDQGQGPGGAGNGTGGQWPVAGASLARVGSEIGNAASKVISWPGILGMKVVDISSLLFGAAFALLGVVRLALAGRDSRIGPVALQGAGMVLTGVGVMIIAVAGAVHSRLGRSRRFR
jgi:hypothetical protein